MFMPMRRMSREEFAAEFLDPHRKVGRPVRDEAHHRLVDLLDIERKIGVHPKYRNRRSRFTKADIALWESAHQGHMDILSRKDAQ